MSSLRDAENTTMSTRSSTAVSKSSQKLSNQLRPEKSRLRRAEIQLDLIENSNSTSQNGRPKKVKRKDLFCSCRGKDVGTPMICCGQCMEWYHFSCIGLAERDAEDIDLFICSPCQEQTGLQTVREWEGPDALEEVDAVTLAAKAMDLKSKRPMEEEEEEEVSKAPAPLHESEPESDPSSDEYVAENQLASRRISKRRLRPMSTPSDGSDATSDAEDKNKTKRARLSRGFRRVHTSSSPPVTLKRKQSNAHQNQPSKKQKSGTNDDPTRKYCLGKLQEIFCRIFLKYPYFHEQSEGDQELDLDSHFTKLTADLTDEEKTQLEEKAKDYATQVENSVFETYSEPDKLSRPVASGKYKERFRMLDFNLSKDDRIVLHKRIVSSSIPPEALSLMSSTDLASEEEKQSIKLAEQESLAHSILNKQTAPRAKITHKGLQDIEDVNGELSSQRDVDMEREQEEEDRRDRERMARLRAIQQQQAAAASASGSVPPESPVVTENPTWGAPPPLPLHTLQRQDQTAPLNPPERPSPTLLFASSDPAIQHQVEGELNLADLINIDDDISQDGILAAEPIATSVAENPPAQTVKDKESESVRSNVSPSSPMSPRPTGISPFAVNTSKPDLTTRPSFDLSSVWSAPKQNEEQRKPEPSTLPEEPKDPLMDVAFFGEEADDQDFDMFLDQDNEAGPSSEGSRKEPVFEDFPRVWNGMLHMPLDSTIPQDVPVVARQLGGRILESDSPLWRTLFPSGNLRIDGRVPVDKSSQYLLQMRMNPTKELIAVAFAPPSDSESLAFKFLMDHLLGKNRHGLVFPWGSGKPKEHHPGRELYIIPLLSSDPLPDYIELLDSLRMPKARTENYLVGIWILNKGKLTAPPTLQTPNPIPTPPQFIPPAAPPPSIPNLPLAPPPSHPPPTAPVPPVPVNSAVLAAEVASLTPDQIQRMLQSLSAAGTSIPAILQQQLQPPPPSTPTQPWSNGTPPYVPFPSHPHAASQSPPQRPYPSYHHYDQYDQYDQYDSGSRRGGRGARGGPGTSGRARGGVGRGNGRERGDRPQDSGWPKRGGRGSSNAGWGDERRW